MTDSILPRSKVKGWLWPQILQTLSLNFLVSKFDKTMQILLKSNKNIHEVLAHLRWKLVEIPIKSWQFKRKVSMLSRTDFLIFFWEWKAAQDCCSLDPLSSSSSWDWRDWDCQVTDCCRLFSGRKATNFSERQKDNTPISDIPHLKHHHLTSS